jgi:hypothetical protein
MTHLYLNDIPLALTSLSISPVRFGAQVAYAYDGSALKTQRRVVRRWSCKTALLTSSEANFWRALIDGEGHSWPFQSDLYSYTGLAANAGNTFTLGTSGYWGNNGMLTGASVGTIATGFLRSSSIYWEYTAGAWRHVIHTSDGTKFVNGATSTATLATANVAGGTVIFSASKQVDGLVILGEAVPNASIAALLYAAHENEFSELPQLRTSGNIGATYVHGEVMSTEVGTIVSGGVGQAGEVIDFALSEVV